MPDVAAPRSIDTGAITHYHAHVYYDPVTTRERAERLREQIAARFPQALLGRWHDVPVGPHPRAMYQVAFSATILGSLLPWLMLNRDGLTILLHPETGDDYATGRSRPARFTKAGPGQRPTNPQPMPNRIAPPISGASIS